MPKKEEKKETKKVVKEAKGKKARKYVEGIGRRKTAIARVRIYPQGKGEFLINEKPYNNYFPDSFYHHLILAPLKMIDQLSDFDVTVKVKGGGITGQAEAIRHGLSRALVKLNPDLKKLLKSAGFLRRDPRERERKKPGLKRARRAPQWSKR